MKVYLAARYSRRDEMREYASNFKAAGYEVTSRWLDTDWETTEQGRSTAAPPEYREQYALIDLEDVQASDIVVSFTEPPGPNPGRGGRHVEFGAAYAWGKALVVVGHRENLFHHLPGVRFINETPREEVFALMLPEVELAISGRGGRVRRDVPKEPFVDGRTPAEAAS